MQLSDKSHISPALCWVSKVVCKLILGYAQLDCSYLDTKPTFRSRTQRQTNAVTYEGK
jgi:hypothetical protein